MEEWIYWLIAAILLALLELILPGFVLLCFGFAAMVTAMICLLHPGIVLEIVSFIIFTIISLVGIRPFFLRHMKPRGGLVETNVHALIGGEAIVTEEINTENNTGRVKIRSEEWGAVSKDSARISAGAKVKVLAISGNKVIVQPY